MADYQASSAPSRSRRIVEWLIHSDHQSPTQARKGRLAAIVLVLALVLTLIASVIGYFLQAQPGNPFAQLAAPAGVLVLALLVLYVVNRRGRTVVAGTGLAALLLIANLTLLYRSGPMTPNAVALAVPVIVAGLFGPPVSTLIFAALAGVGYLWLNLQADPEYFANLLTGQTALQTGLAYLNLLFVAVISWLFSRSTKEVLDESQQLSLTLVEQRREMEDRLRTQTRHLQATTNVARAVAGSRDLDQLLADIVRLVRETFDYYHVQVFMVDEAQGYAVLRQSTGEVGQQLLARGHRLAVGSLSVIGQVTARKEVVVARDTDTDAVHRRNELLPLTRSEMAVPLIVGDNVIGALDLQSVEPDAFAEETIPTLRAMADQLAIAIENARLYEQVQENLREFRELSHDMTRRSWSEFLAQTSEEERMQIHGPESQALQIHRSRVIERVLGAGSVIVSTGKDGRQTFLAAPIVVRDEIVGVLGVEPDGPREWTQEDLRLVQSVADRTALAIENARLYIQAQRAADRERLINTIAARLQRAPSLALLLESAAQELADALGTDNVYAEFSVERPLGRTRKQVPHAASDLVEEEASPGDDIPAPDEPEEARAEL